MRRLTVVFAGLLLAGIFNPPNSHAQPVEPERDIRALASSPQWLTTKVYIEGEPDKDVKANYPGVVGISMWDPQRNRYEFFYTETGRSKYADGGGGYFLITGDRKTHILVPDVGPVRTVVRRLEKLDNSEFTYSGSTTRQRSQPADGSHICGARPLQRAPKDSHVQLTNFTRRIEIPD